MGGRKRIHCESRYAIFSILLLITLSLVQISFYCLVPERLEPMFLPQTKIPGFHVIRSKFEQNFM